MKLVLVAATFSAFWGKRSSWVMRATFSIALLMSKAASKNWSGRARRCGLRGSGRWYVLPSMPVTGGRDGLAGSTGCG
ncbi:hypothetical protein N864_05815 [Intrasporangium chromatireducens Q5-1]|uniref:Uncharacterized protein n=1 Tax=Intrasporangium chromatireducens Q5-1 TaxID=584657 RepID=W9GF37_9MICO|nr:hypothetical protein [Intrasporangium chromatireducens]EWT04826.1 hypothetical protein N864_05815 [Intrasporangium chromatireducens Q5-1]